MKGVEERTVDQIGRPDHCGRPHQEATRKSSQSISSAESCDAEENLECPAELLAVENLLGQEDICRIKNTTAVSSLETRLARSLVSAEKGLTLDMATITTCSL